MKRKKKKGKMRAIILGIFMVPILLYTCGILYFYSHFLPETTINGIDVSGMAVEDVIEQMQQYVLWVKEWTADGNYIEEAITGEQIGLRITEKSALEKILEEQNPGRWLLKESREHEENVVASYDKAALEKAVDQLRGFGTDFFEKPQNAFISDYEEGKGYHIEKEIEGNVLIKEKTLKSIEDAVMMMQGTVDLKEMGCYELPSITSEDTNLNRLLNKLNTYVGVSIIYQFGDAQEVLDGTIIQEWLSIENGDVILNAERAQEFTKELKVKYDTIFRRRKFLTTYGTEVTINGGDYGWWMNYVDEAEELVRMIERGESGQREPIYYQKAAFYGENDYGNTYVEINLTAQHLFFYENGIKILESDFVSGTAFSGNVTPDGVYSLTYKERNAVLVGETYETPVSYWMPFNQNIGLHDAIWRSEFGSDIYKRNGSHGCVNLPYAVAKELYAHLEQGMPVICYELPGTESDSITYQTAENKAQSVIDAIDRIGTVTGESQKRIQRARQLYNEVGSEVREYVTNYPILLEAEQQFKLVK